MLKRKTRTETHTLHNNYPYYFYSAPDTVSDDIIQEKI